MIRKFHYQREFVGLTRVKPACALKHVMLAEEWWTATQTFLVVLGVFRVY